MKTIVLYCRRNVGLYALSYLVAKGFIVKVISDDENVLWLAGQLRCEVITLDTMWNFDFFMCVHGNRFVPEKYIAGKPAINVHPMLFRYLGHNPIRKVIENGDRRGSVECHVMTNEIDKGEVIHREFFDIPPCRNPADFYNVAVPFYYKCFAKTLEKLGL